MSMNPNDYSSPASPSMRALAAWNPEPAPTVAPPTHVFEGFVVAPWLRALYARDLYGSPSRTVIAYGTAARLWTPPASREAVQTALRGDDNPLLLFRAWFAALPRETRSHVSEFLTIAMDRLADELDDVTIETAAAWLRDRDDVTSVVAALASVPPTGTRGLGHAAFLARIDAKARTHASTWQHPDVVAGIARDPRFGAVAWQEPESLVGAIAGYALETAVRR